MKDISHKIIDVYDDLEFAGLEKIASISLPEDIKKMELISKEKLEQMHDDNFGLICFDKYANKVRRYPIHDKQHTWLSAQYFDKTASALTPVLREQAANRIKIACLRFDIDGHPKSVDGDFEKKANVNNTYALRNEFPINDKDEVKLAAGYFNKYASQFTDPKDRNEFASNVLKKADELKVSIQNNHKEQLTKYASSKYNPCFSLHIEQRKNLLSGKEKELDFLEKIASVKKNETPQKVADVLYEFDKKAGISKYWDSKLKNPYESTMDIEKIASHNFEIGEGDMTDKDLIKVLSGDKIKSYLGESVVKTIKKSPVTVFESLPKPHQEIIYNIHKGLL